MPKVVEKETINEISLVKKPRKKYKTDICIRCDNLGYNTWSGEEFNRRYCNIKHAYFEGRVLECTYFCNKAFNVFYYVNDKFWKNSTVSEYIEFINKYWI